MVKFGAKGRTWDSLPTLNFVNIAQWKSSLGGNFLPNIRIFFDFELLEPTFLYL